MDANAEIPEKQKPKLTLTTEDQRVARRQQVWNMRIEKGMSSWKIAAELGVSQPTVWRDIRVMTRQASKNLEGQVTEETATQLARLQHLVAEAMQSWENSKKRFTSLSERKERVSRKNPAGEPTGELIDLKQVVNTRVEERQGNPAFLEAALKAMRDIRQILDIGQQKIDINLWRKELEEQGLEPSEVFEAMVQAALIQNQTGIPVEFSANNGERPKQD